MTDVLADYFDNLTKSFLTTLNTPQDYLNKIALTAIVVFIGMLLHWLLKKLVTKNVSDLQRRFTVHKVTKRVIVIIITIISVFIWIQAINALILISLLFGFFIVVLVRGLINNIIGFFVIKYRRYFKDGHRIEIDGIIGDVIDINMINFELLEVRNWLSSDSNTGRVIKLPNKIIFDQKIEMVGISNELLWHEIKYVLTFDSDWQAAEKIMVDAGDAYFNQSILPMLDGTNDHLPKEKERLYPVFSVDTNDDGIVLILRYIVDYRKGTSTKTHLQRTILRKFDDNLGINFAVLDIRILSE